MDRWGGLTGALLAGGPRNELAIEQATAHFHSAISSGDALVHQEGWEQAAGTLLTCGESEQVQPASLLGGPRTLTLRPLPCLCPGPQELGLGVSQGSERPTQRGVALELEDQRSGPSTEPRKMAAPPPRFQHSCGPTWSCPNPIPPVA